MSDKTIRRQIQNMEFQPTIYKQVGHTTNHKNASE